MKGLHIIVNGVHHHDVREITVVIPAEGLEIEGPLEMKFEGGKLKVVNQDSSVTIDSPHSVILCPTSSREMETCEA